MSFRFKKTSHPSYSVSENGDVRNDRTGRILRPSSDVYGYLLVTLPGRRNTRIHHLVAESFIGPRNAPEINHIDGNKQNNHYSNLEYCSQRRNYEHAIRTGLRTKNTNRKLTDDQIRYIKRKTEWAYGEQSELARKWNVAIATVNDTKRGRIWKDV